MLTVSDGVVAGVREDTSGGVLEERLRDGGYQVQRRTVPDERPLIVAALRELAAEADLVLTTGGTGFAPRDVTLDAVLPLFEKTVEGFGELFRMLSWQQVGAAAMLSRAAAGVVGERAVFLLPGSPKAVSLAMEKLILPEAGHLLSQARRE